MLHNLFHTEHVYQICFSLCFSRIPLQLIFTPFFGHGFSEGTVIHELQMVGPKRSKF